jgi:hypothetical protein
MWAFLQPRLIAWAAVAVAALAGLAAVFRAGKTSERLKQTSASLKSLRSREKTDDQIAKMSDGSVRERLDRWVPDDGER